MAARCGPERLDKDHPDRLPPSIPAAYSTTFGIKRDDNITFFVRTFRTVAGKETWDFGDGSPKVEVQSDGNIVPISSGSRRPTAGGPRSPACTFASGWNDRG